MARPKKKETVKRGRKPRANLNIDVRQVRKSERDTKVLELPKGYSIDYEKLREGQGIRKIELPIDSLIWKGKIRAQAVTPSISKTGNLNLPKAWLALEGLDPNSSYIKLAYSSHMRSILLLISSEPKEGYRTYKQAGTNVRSLTRLTSEPELWVGFCPTEKVFVAGLGECYLLSKPKPMTDKEEDDDDDDLGGAM